MDIETTSQGHPASEHSLGSYDSFDSFEGDGASWAIQQRLFSILHQLEVHNVTFPVLFVLEQLLFLYFGCHYLLPDSIFPSNFPREVIVWTISIALSVSVLCLFLIVVCIWQFWKKNEVDKIVGKLFQLFGSLYGSTLLFVLMSDAAITNDITLQMMFAASIILWLILVVPFQILGLYPRGTIKPSLDSRSDNRIGILFLISKISIFVMEISLSSESNNSLYIGFQVLLFVMIAGYIINRLPYIRKGMNEFVLFVMYMTTSLLLLRYIFHRFGIDTSLTNVIISITILLLMTIPASFLTIFLRKRSIGYERGLVDQLQRKTVPTSIDSSQEQFGEGGDNFDEEARTPVIESYVNLLLRRAKKPFEIDIKMRDIWRLCDIDIVSGIYENLFSRVDSDASTVDSAASFLSLRYTEYLLEYIEHKRSMTTKEYGRYSVEGDDNKSLTETQRMLFQVVKALRKCYFRQWDFRFRTYSVRERRIELDQTNRSRQLILAKHIRRAEKLRGEGIRILAEFWRHVAKGSSAEKLSQYVDMLYRVERKGHVIYSSLMSTFARNPVVLRSYAQFVEKIELNVEKAHQIRMSSDDDGGGEYAGMDIIQRMEGEKDTNASDRPKPPRSVMGTPERVALPPTPKDKKRISFPSQQDRIRSASLAVRCVTNLAHPNSPTETNDTTMTLQKSNDTESSYGSVMNRGRNGQRRLSENYSIPAEGIVVDGGSEHNYKEETASMCGRSTTGGSITAQSMLGCSSTTSMSRQEREQIISHSPVCRRLYISIYVVLFAVLIVGIILFFVTNNFVHSQFDEEGDDPEKEGREKLFYRYIHTLEVGTLWHQTPFQARMAERARRLGSSDASHEVEAYEELHEELHVAYNHISSAGTEEASSAWEKHYAVKKNWPTSDTDAHEHDFKYSQLSAFDIFSDMMLSTETLASCIKGENSDQIGCNDTMKYVLINGEYSWADAVEDIEDAYRETVAESIDMIEIIVISSFSSCILVLILVILFVFVPVLLKIKREKQGAFQMFTLIPKEETAKLYRTFATEANKQGTTGTRLSKSKESQDSLAGMPWRFSLSLAILGMTVSGMLVLPLMFTSDSHLVDIELHGFSETSSLVFQSFFYLREMLANDSQYVPTYWTIEQQREALEENTEKLRGAWKEFLFGNDEHPPVAYRTSELLHVLMVDEESVNAHVQEFLSTFDYFTRLDESSMTLDDEHFLETDEETHCFLELTELAQELYQDYYSKRTELYRLLNVVIFIFCFPLLLFIYFILLRPSVRIIYEQNRKMRSLFLLLPMNCLQQQQLIMDYIFSGQYSDDKEVVQTITSSERKKGRILQAASDGFIEINKDLCVTEYNMAAARIFGYEAEKVVGQNVEMLFDEISNIILVKEVEGCHRAFGESSKKRHKEVEKREGREVIGLKNDGNKIDVRIHLIAQLIEEEVVVAGFLEDITLEKMQKKLLDEEKAKSNQLLLNILPHNIAERLKNGDELIADKHLDCTIIFTDIVGFTRYSSDKEPEEVVRRLRALFTRYDELSMEAKVMKIKTIGDAYMAVMGLEEEVKNDPYVVTDLALKMIKAAQECDFEIRAGIHVGKLTAGVVGVQKMTYDVWGNSVNIASRMESTSVPGYLQVSRGVYERVYDKFTFRERKIGVKGFDEEQFVYLCLGRKDECDKTDTPDSCDKMSFESGLEGVSGSVCDDSGELCRKSDSATDV